MANYEGVKGGLAAPVLEALAAKLPPVSSWGGGGGEGAGLGTGRPGPAGWAGVGRQRVSQLQHMRPGPGLTCLLHISTLASQPPTLSLSHSTLRSHATPAHVPSLAPSLDAPSPLPLASPPLSPQGTQVVGCATSGLMGVGPGGPFELDPSDGGGGGRRRGARPGAVSVLLGRMPGCRLRAFCNLEPVRRGE